MSEIPLAIFEPYIDPEKSSMEWDPKNAIALRNVPLEPTHPKRMRIPTVLLAESMVPAEMADAVMEVVKKIREDQADIVIIPKDALRALDQLFYHTDYSELHRQIEDALQRAAALHTDEEGHTVLVANVKFDPFYDFRAAVEDAEASRGNLYY